MLKTVLFKKASKQKYKLPEMKNAFTLYNVTQGYIVALFSTLNVLNYNSTFVFSLFK